MPFQMSEWQKAYLAGFVDADGCVSIASGGYSPLVRVVNTNLEVIELIQSWAGGTYYSEPRSKKVMHGLYWCSRRSVLELLLPIMPYMVVKHRQADLVTDFCLDERSRDEKSSIVKEVRELNRR